VLLAYTALRSNEEENYIDNSDDIDELLQMYPEPVLGISNSAEGLPQHMPGASEDQPAMLMPLPQDGINVVKPTIVEFQFPTAGQPVPGQSQSTNEAYKNTIRASEATGPLHAPNIYAPFKSKTDWEIARWAKLQDIGSTSFTDLLRIQGVRYVLIYTYKY
jgi:hypothetical protein